MAERVRVDVESGVAHVRLDRADKLNALDASMFDAIIAAGERIIDDRSIRAVVLSGEGRAFCAGLDFMSFVQMGDGGGARLFERGERSPANAAQRAAHVWVEVPVPVIAAVHGYAFGGGLQIALGADVRLVAPDAQLSVMEIKWGLVPDMAGTQLLRNLVRLDVAKELTFTGRKVDGVEAVQLGLATRVSEKPLEDALGMARTIAAKSPHAIRAGKRLLDESRYLGRKEGLLLEEELQKSLIGSPNQLEAVQANMQKREPKFDDPT